MTVEETCRLGCLAVLMPCAAFAEPPRVAAPAFEGAAGQVSAPDGVPPVGAVRAQTDGELLGQFRRLPELTEQMLREEKEKSAAESGKWAEIRANQARIRAELATIAGSGKAAKAGPQPVELGPLFARWYFVPGGEHQDLVSFAVERGFVSDTIGHYEKMVSRVFLTKTGFTGDWHGEDYLFTIAEMKARLAPHLDASGALDIERVLADPAFAAAAGEWDGPFFAFAQDQHDLKTVLGRHGLSLGFSYEITNDPPMNWHITELDSNKPMQDIFKPHLDIEYHSPDGTPKQPRNYSADSTAFHIVPDLPEHRWPADVQTRLGWGHGRVIINSLNGPMTTLMTFSSLHELRARTDDFRDVERVLVDSLAAVRR